jgi:hypothetical protein
MTKKFKINELENDPNLPPGKKEGNTQVSRKVLVDELSDEDEFLSSRHEVSSPTPTPKDKSSQKEIKNSRSSVEIKESPRPHVEKSVYLERNIFISYLARATSVLVVLTCIDFIYNLLKYFDGVDVSKLENYHSLFLWGATNWLICKIIGFLIFVYFTASKEEIKLNSKGIYCQEIEVLNSIFFSSNITFITWDKISSVKFKMRLFEPYLFLYGQTDEKIGQIEFSILSKDTFFDYVLKNAGKEHPLYKIKNEVSLF